MAWHECFTSEWLNGARARPWSACILRHSMGACFHKCLASVVSVELRQNDSGIKTLSSSNRTGSAACLLLTHGHCFFTHAPSKPTLMEGETHNWNLCNGPCELVHALARGHWKLHPRGSQQRSQQPSLELLQLGLVGLGKVVQFAALSTSLLFDNPGCRNFHHWTLLFGASPIAQTLPKLCPPWTLEAALRVSGPSSRSKNRMKQQGEHASEERRSHTQLDWKASACHLRIDFSLEVSFLMPFCKHAPLVRVIPDKPTPSMGATSWPESCENSMPDKANRVFAGCFFPMGCTRLQKLRA